MTVPQWATCDLPSEPDYVSPGGVSEIRLLPSFPDGELAHARTLPEHVSTAAVLTRITEFFYILAGHGELWRGSGEVEELVELVPRRCASIPPGVHFQYRAGPEALQFIVCSAPRWERKDWNEAPRAYWPGRERESVGPGSAAPWATVDLRDQFDRHAPDGSEIRFLPEVDAGGLAHCTLPPRTTSRAMRHRTVNEVWYVLEGEGDLWRATGDDEERVRLLPGRASTIPVGTSFQFRATAARALRILIGTFPRWPEGETEAEPVHPHWR